MKWFKIETNDILFGGYTNNQIAVLVKYHALYAQFEKEPNSRQLQSFFNKNELRELENLLKLKQNELKSIQNEIDLKKNHRQVDLKKKHENNNLSKNSTSIRQPREEKEKNIKESNNINIITKENPENDTIDLEELIAKTPDKKKRFAPPTLEDVKAYIAERDCAAVVDAKKFFDYFEAGHWHDSEGKPVRNWKQKLITWETHGRQTRTLKAAQGLLGVKSGTYAEDVPL